MNSAAACGACATSLGAMTVKRLENLALRAPCSSSRLADTSSVDTLAANQTVLSAFAAFTQQHFTGCSRSTEEGLNNHTIDSKETAGIEWYSRWLVKRSSAFMQPVVHLQQQSTCPHSQLTLIMHNSNVCMQQTGVQTEGRSPKVAHVKQRCKGSRTFLQEAAGCTEGLTCQQSTSFQGLCIAELHIPSWHLS